MSEAELIKHQAELQLLLMQLVDAKLDLALLEDEERQELAPAIARGRKEREARWRQT